MKNIFLLCFLFMGLGMASAKKIEKNAPVIINGAMPAVTKDAAGIVHMVFVRSDQLLYAISKDNGSTFSTPVVIDKLKDIFGAAGRGPQIVATLNGLCVLAPDKAGNIYCYTKDQNSSWQQNGKVNDVNDIAKEGFISVASYKDSVYAVWLDLRNNNKNKITGSLSTDGGKRWSKNTVIYQSPEGSVCECCKPSVSFTSLGIHVMFRNNLQGNRDLYVTHSVNGTDFNEAMKLGNISWKLNACPMDGGGLGINDKETLQTIWRRTDTIFSCIPGEEEKMLGKGRNCTIETAGNEYLYAWMEKNNIICVLPGNKKINIGEGVFPVLKAVDQKQVLCIWQSNNNIYSKLINI